MSVCYEINCHDCKESLWVGQRDHLYAVPTALSQLDRFLFAHEGHQLSFDNDNRFEDYKEVCTELARGEI